MPRGYQLGFSEMHHDSMHGVEGRERKAATMVAVLSDFVGGPLGDLDALDVAASTGIIDQALARSFRTVTGVDIDQGAIAHAHARYGSGGLRYVVADAMALPFSDARFDVVVASQVYEHVPDAERLMAEIQRVLKPGGLCYFAAGNRFNVVEGHYKLPFLSAIPRPLAHWYIRAAGKADFYYEKHRSLWGLRRLARAFEVHDYTRRIIADPERFGAAYMLPPGSVKRRVAGWVVNRAYGLCPGFIWILKKPGAARSAAIAA
ncbi:MAG: class I SAM-dependent methyltransferase [Myxococcales bacterium]|nr:class I SAM-dependent methyltransferase [Myxococcales bacterium]